MINQFLLPKSESVELIFELTKENKAFTLISKNSLRNLDLSVILKEEDITFKDGGYLYPNGYSYFFDTNTYDTTESCKIKIGNNKINSRDEVIILGYTLYDKPDDFFHNPVINGYQLYLEKVQNVMGYLNILLNKVFYYTYQLYTKNVDFYYYDANKISKGIHNIKEYSSMVCNQEEAEKMSFYLGKYTGNNLGISIQFLDFNDLEVVQKNLQPLVTGMPKSILIPEGKSLYHFLPPV